MDFHSLNQERLETYLKGSLFKHFEKEDVYLIVTGVDEDHITGDLMKGGKVKRSWMTTIFDFADEFSLRRPPSTYINEIPLNADFPEAIYICYSDAKQWKRGVNHNNVFPFKPTAPHHYPINRWVGRQMFNPSFCPADKVAEAILGQELKSVAISPNVAVDYMFYVWFRDIKIGNWVKESVQLHEGKEKFSGPVMRDNINVI